MSSGQGVDCPVCQQFCNSVNTFVCPSCVTARMVQADEESSREREGLAAARDAMAALLTAALPPHAPPSTTVPPVAVTIPEGVSTG